MNVRDMFVRQARYVPSDNGTQLADYVLQRMEEMKRQEAKEKLDIEKKEVELMAETSLAAETPALTKRAKSIASGEVSRMVTSRESAMGRMNTTGSPGQSPIRKRFGPTASTSYEKFRRVHPQIFSSFMGAPSGSLMLEDSVVDPAMFYDSAV